MGDVTITLEADAEGYRYKLSCVKNGQNVEVGEREEDFENTINAKYLLALNAALARMKMVSNITIKVKKNGIYVAGAIEQDWPHMWSKQNWLTAKRKEVKHKELWQQYMRNSSKHNITMMVED